MPNQVPMKSTVRNPRGLIKVNDIVVKNIENFTYVENNFYQSDTFRVVMPIYGQDPRLTVEYWQSQPAMMIEIFAGFPNDPLHYGPGDLESLIKGGVDQLDVNVFQNGCGITFSGRDLSSKLVDNQTTEKYPNLTASQIAEKLAAKRGLKAKVTPTKTKAGYYYTQNYVQMSSQVSEWDLLTFLAQQIGFQVFVRGETLYFEPMVIDTSNPYRLDIQMPENGKEASFNGSSLIVSRNLLYARDAVVKVISWNSKHGRVTAQARATPNKRTALAAAAQPIGQAQTYTIRVPGLTKEQAIQYAQNTLQNITLHERVLQATLPADNTLHKDSVIQLKGVCPSTNQNFYPDSITRNLSPTAGYNMTVRAKNHSPQSTVTA